MKCCGFCGVMTDFVLLLNRVALGGFFLAAGWGKVLGEGGVEKFNANYMGMVEKMNKLAVLPAWMLGEDWSGFHNAYSQIVPYAEIILGALLIIGLLGRLCSFLIAGMLASFTVALYGAGAFYSGSGPFHTNVILALLALLLVFTGAGLFSVDRWLFGSGCKRENNKELEPVDASRLVNTPHSPTNDEV